jgi:hypothetical protein
MDNIFNSHNCLCFVVFSNINQSALFTYSNPEDAKFMFDREEKIHADSGYGFNLQMIIKPEGKGFNSCHQIIKSYRNNDGFSGKKGNVVRELDKIKVPCPINPSFLKKGKNYESD